MSPEWGTWYDQKCQTPTAEQLLRDREAKVGDVDQEVRHVAAEMLLGQIAMPLPTELATRVRDSEAMMASCMDIVSRYAGHNIVFSKTARQLVSLSGRGICLGDDLYLHESQISMPLVEFLYWMKERECCEKVLPAISDWLGVQQNESLFVTALNRVFEFLWTELRNASIRAILDT